MNWRQEVAFQDVKAMLYSFKCNLLPAVELMRIRVWKHLLEICWGGGRGPAARGLATLIVTSALVCMQGIEFI